MVRWTSSMGNHVNQKQRDGQTDAYMVTHVSSLHMVVRPTMSNNLIAQGCYLVIHYSMVAVAILTLAYCLRLLSEYHFFTIFNVSLCGPSLTCLAGAIFSMIFNVSSG